MCSSISVAYKYMYPSGERKKTKSHSRLVCVCSFSFLFFWLRSILIYANFMQNMFLFRVWIWCDKRRRRSAVSDDYKRTSKRVDFVVQSFVISFTNQLDLKRLIASNGDGWFRRFHADWHDSKTTKWYLSRCPVLWICCWDHVTWWLMCSAQNEIW